MRSDPLNELPICRAWPSGEARFAAYSLAGLLAATGGLLLSLVSLSGEASAGQGGFVHTELYCSRRDRRQPLFSADQEGIIGSICGALVLRTISDLLFGLQRSGALAAPGFKDLSCSDAVCLGGLRVLRRKNQMDVFQ